MLDRFQPRWVAPLVARRASSRARNIRGQVFESSGVAERWHRGPSTSDVPATREEAEALARPFFTDAPLTTMADVA